MPCKPAKALQLLKSGKAFWERDEGGGYHLRLRFDPKSPIMSPPEGANRGVDLNSPSLAELRNVAKRKNVWDRVLRRDERAVVDLTIRCVDRPRSPELIVRVKEALMGPLRRLMGQVGKPLAMKLSRRAVGRGYKAERWAEDRGFIGYLTVMDMAFQGLALSRGL